MGRLASCLARGSVSHFTSALRQDTSFVLDHPGAFSSSQYQPPTAASAVARPWGARNPARTRVWESRLAALSSLLPGRGRPTLEASVGRCLPRLHPGVANPESSPSCVRARSVTQAESLQFPEERGWGRGCCPQAPAPGQWTHTGLEGSRLPFFCLLSFPSQPAGGNVWAHSSQNFWMGTTALAQPPCTELCPLFYFCRALCICCPPPRAQGRLGPALHKCWLNE